MKPSHKEISVFLLYLVQLATQVHAGTGTQFASHVSVNTPARSFTHGVGDPLPAAGQRPLKNNRRSGPQYRSRGYPRITPSIPFTVEEAPRNVPSTASIWHNNMEIQIPLLPASPYKVDSPDPESLWPEGLFLPPFNPQRFDSHPRRSDSNKLDPQDPYLLEGSEAIAAVTRAKNHRELYFHDIPHIESLFANQELRIKNNLKPHIIGSIRHTWPYNRP